MNNINEKDIIYDVSLLIAEDDFASRTFMYTFFKKKVSKIFLAEDGEQAIEIFSEHKPEIVFTDISMPKANGLELAKVVKKIAPKTYIALTTAFDNPRYFLEAIDIGVNQYVIKPISKENIYEAFLRAVDFVTADKRAIEQQEKINKLSNAVEQSQNGVLIINSERIIEYANDKVGDFFSVYNSNGEFISIREFFEDLEALAFVFKQSYEPKDKWRGTLPFESNGETIWASLSISVLLDDQLSLKNLLIIIQDITEIKKAQDDLRKSHEDLEIKVKERTKELIGLTQRLQTEIKDKNIAMQTAISAKEEAQAANKAKSQFLANMSHELRTPLNGILGLTSILLDANLEEKQKHFLRMVKTSAQSLLKIINEILDISRIEAGKYRLENAPFNLLDMISETIDFLSQSASEKGLELKLIIDGEMPELVIGDEGKLRQAIINLVANSIKFTDEGFIRVDVALVEIVDGIAEIEIKVSDTGIGIPKDKIDVLFKSFSQVDASYTRKYGGVGLGLAITKEIIQLMCGEIKVSSDFGKGSDFIFTIKMETGSPNLIKETKSTIEETKFETNFELNILIAEDSIINQEVLKELISNQGWKYQIANNGLEAVNLYELGDFDLILMDVQMPELDGLEATKLIREHKKDKIKRIPIIGITAHANKIHQDQCFDAGMDGYISKPFDFDQFFETINNIQKCELETVSNIDSEIIDIDLSMLLKSLNFNQSVFQKIIDYFSENYLLEIN